MKLRNKFLIIFFILALTLCLALASSASNYFDISDYTEFLSYGPIDFYTTGGLPTYNGERLGVIVLSGIDFRLGFINIEGWHNLIVTNNINDHITLKEYVLNLCGYDCVSAAFNDYSDKLWNAYCDYVLTINGEGKSYDEGVTDGIKEAHEFTYNWLEENNILGEPWAATGEFSALEGLLEDNVLPAISRARTETLNYAIYSLENWLTSKGLTVKDYNNDGTVTAIDNLILANFDSAYADWVKEGRKDSISRLSQWLSNNDIKYADFENSGLLSDIDNGLNLNVLPALEAQFQNGYNRGENLGVNIGKTEMYNELMGHINTSFGTEYPTSDGSNYDFTVPSQAYTVAYEAGELYQINKFTDDSGISDFLADISGTVLSTFFYLGTNISFMGTTALSLISLFVIAAIVIFVLKFFNKG